MSYLLHITNNVMKTFFVTESKSIFCIFNLNFVIILAGEKRRYSKLCLPEVHQKLTWSVYIFQFEDSELFISFDVSDIILFVSAARCTYPKTIEPHTI